MLGVDRLCEYVMNPVLFKCCEMFSRRLGGGHLRPFLPSLITDPGLRSGLHLLPWRKEIKREQRYQVPVTSKSVAVVST